ncbi:MAG: AMP-binding protein, partial [Halobacteriaceae archaeon]
MDWLAAEKEYSAPPIGINTLSEMFAETVERNSTRLAQSYKGNIYDRTITPDILPEPATDEFRSITYERMGEIVENLAVGFRELGVELDDRVAIFAHTRMEWAQCDFAILTSGGVVTTVYPESSPQQIEYLLQDSDATGIVLEGPDQFERLTAVEDSLDLQFIITIDHVHSDRDDLYTLKEVHDIGKQAQDKDTYETL